MEHRDMVQVAILLATYNGERYLREQLQSLCEQSFRDFRCYVHDDGSKDATMEIVREFCEKDPLRFAVMEGPPCGGAKENFLYMLRNAPDTPYTMFCDQDDVWRADKIEVSMNAMREAEKSTPLVCVYSDAEVVDGKLDTICPSFMLFNRLEPVPENLLAAICRNSVIGCTIMINRGLREQCCRLEDDSLVYMHDWWIAMLAQARGALCYIDEPLLRYRLHENNTLGAREVKATEKLRHLLSYCAHPLREIRRSMLAERRAVMHACALDPVLDAADPDRELVHRLASLRGRGKLARAHSYWKYGLIRPRNIWRLLWV